jgi:hypothetical protein
MSYSVRQSPTRASRVERWARHSRVSGDIPRYCVKQASGTLSQMDANTVGILIIAAAVVATVLAVLAKRVEDLPEWQTPLQRWSLSSSLPAWRPSVGRS